MWIIPKTCISYIENKLIYMMMIPTWGGMGLCIHPIENTDCSEENSDGF